MPGSGVDRRTLIKGAAAAGALAWTAPIIIDSVASPAGALTCGTCFRVQFPSGADTPGPSCTVTSQTVGTLQSPCPTLTAPGCLSTSDVAANATLGSVCIGGDCRAHIGTAQFNLDAGSACFTAGTCGSGRRFLAAQAKVSTDACITGVIGGSGDTVATFTKPGPDGDSTWVWFQFIIGCSCA